MTPGRSGLAIFVALGLLTAPARADPVQVIIDKLVFTPAEVNAKVGDTVEWINKDALVHTATATNGEWNVNIAANQSAKLVVNKPGAADYFCKFHPNMKGRVVVTP